MREYVLAYLFRILEVVEQCPLVPSNALVHISGGVGETTGLAGLTAKNTECHVDMS